MRPTPRGRETRRRRRCGPVPAPARRGRGPQPGRATPTCAPPEPGRPAGPRLVPGRSWALGAGGRGSPGRLAAPSSRRVCREAATPGPPPGPGLRAGAAGRCLRWGGPGGPRCARKRVPGKPRPAAEGPARDGGAACGVGGRLCLAGLQPGAVKPGRGRRRPAPPAPGFKAELPPLSPRGAPGRAQGPRGLKSPPSRPGTQPPHGTATGLNTLIYGGKSRPGAPPRRAPPALPVPPRAVLSGRALGRPAPRRPGERSETRFSESGLRVAARRRRLAWASPAPGEGAHRGRGMGSGPRAPPARPPPPRPRRRPRLPQSGARPRRRPWGRLRPGGSRCTRRRRASEPRGRPRRALRARASPACSAEASAPPARARPRF